MRDISDERADLRDQPYVVVGVTDISRTRPWQSGDLAILRASEPLFAPPAYPRRLLAGRSVRPFLQRVADQVTTPGQRWTGQVVVSDDRLIVLAGCCWEPADPDSAVLTVDVAERWQTSDLGRRALHDLVGRCRDMGLTTFSLDYMDSTLTLAAMLEAIGVRCEAGGRYSLSSVTRAGPGHITIRAAG